MEENKSLHRRIQRAMDKHIPVPHDPYLLQKIVNKTKGEELMKKKLSLSAVLLALICFVALGVLASQLLFAKTFDLHRWAREEMAKKYGITEELLTVFHQTPVVEEGDTKTLRFEGYDIWAEELGIYTATEKAGKRELTWNHDGESTEGGLDAKVFGKEQITLICTDYGNSYQYFQQKSGKKAAPPTEEEMEKSVAEHEANRAAIEKIAKISGEEAEKIAKEALFTLYPAIKENEDKMEMIGWGYVYYGEIPSISISFAFDIEPYNGQYVVDIHAETGEILDVFIDSGLAGNG